MRDRKKISFGYFKRLYYRNTYRNATKGLAIAKQYMLLMHDRGLSSRVCTRKEIETRDYDKSEARVVHSLPSNRETKNATVTQEFRPQPTNPSLSSQNGKTLPALSTNFSSSVVITDLDRVTAI